MYQVLARKWRPKNFHQLVGQAHVAQALTYALDHNRIHHAYLFTGTRGVGKTTIARIFAKSLNCQKNGISSNPCGECNHCLEIDQGRFPDLLEVDAASRTGVDDTRELLDNVPYAPVKGKFKVYLIDEVHMFSKSSFNALLKTLEEPPSHVKFILATTDPQKLPATILSRCLQFHLKNMSESQIAGHLSFILEREQATFEKDALQLLAHAAAGSMRDSLSLLDQALAYGQGKITTHDVSTLLGAISTPQLLNLLETMVNGDAKGMRGILITLDEYSPDYSALLQSFLQCLQKMSIIQLNAQRPEDEIPPKLQNIALRMPVELTQLWYQIATDTWQNLPYQPDPRIALEMGFLRMLALQPVLPQMAIEKIRPIPEAKEIDTKTNFAEMVADLQDHHTDTSQNTGEQQPLGAAEKYSSQPPQQLNNMGDSSVLYNAEQEKSSPAVREIAAEQSALNDDIPPWQDIPPSPSSNPSPHEPVNNVENNLSHHGAEQEKCSPAVREIAAEQSALNDDIPPWQDIPPSPSSNPSHCEPVNNAESDLTRHDRKPEKPNLVVAKELITEQVASTNGDEQQPSEENISDSDPYTDLPPWDHIPDEVYEWEDQPPHWEEDLTWEEEGQHEKKPSQRVGKSLEMSATEWIKDVKAWSEFLLSLPIDHFPLMLLENCCPYQWQNPVLSLFVDKTGESFNNAQNLALAEEALSTFFHSPCQLRFTLQEEDFLTPRLFYQNQRDLHDKETRENFLSHSMVKAAREVFGEKVRINNIQSTK